MPSQLNDNTLKELAKIGALARLEQIEAERTAILAAFPDLGGGRGVRRSAAPARSQASRPAAAKRRRRPMTAAQRKDVADRMKRYWAERRKAKAAE